MYRPDWDRSIRCVALVCAIASLIALAPPMVLGGQRADSAAGIPLRIRHQLWSERGEDVRALARSESAAAAVAARGAVGCRGDVTDLDALTVGMRGAEVVVHAAARLRGGWVACWTSCAG